MRAAEVPSQNGRLVRPFDVGLKLDNKKTWHFRAAVERLGLLICPSGGLLTGLSSLISDFPKNILVPTHPKSHLEFSHPTPPEGRIMIVTDAGRDAVDAAAFCARRDCRAGWRKARERSPSERTRDVAAYGEVVWS